MKNQTNPERGRRRPAQAARKTPLKVTHDKYAELYDIAPISYFTLDRKGAIRSVNLIGAGLMGMAPSRIVGRRFRFFVAAGDRPAFDLLLEEVFATRAIRRCELALSRKRKAPLFVRLDATVSKDGHECHAVLSDITECKRATEALRRSERFAQETIDAFPAHICLLDDSGTIIAVNKGWRDFAAANQLVLQNVAEGVNYLAVCDAATGPDATEAAAFAAGIRAVMNGDQEDFSLEYPCHSPNEQRWFIGQVTRLLKRGFAQIVVAHDNITGRKKAEEALRVAIQEWRTTFDAVNSGICLVGRNQKILRCNRAFADLFRQMPAQLIGSNCCELLHGAALPFAGCPLLKAIQSRRRETGEIALGERWFEIVVDPILDATGEFQCGVHIINDITERKQAEKELRDSQKQLRSLAASLQIVREEERTNVAREIHDVLTQELTLLKMDIAWLSRRMAQPLDEEKRKLVREKLAVMTDLTDRAIHSVQKIATELRPLVLDSLGLLAAIEWQAKEFKEHTGIQCEVLLPQEAISLDRDRSTAIFRIVQESLTNVVRHAAATRVEIQLEVESDQVRLFVRDNGRGIRPHEHKDPHSIGLVGMRERALSLHGQCEITGRPGEGTTVIVRLPLPPNDRSEEQP